VHFAEKSSDRLYRALKWKYAGNREAGADSHEPFFRVHVYLKESATVFKANDPLWLNPTNAETG
jgi:hypothetical protein